ncbi:MAG: TfoX/Sxy family protein [Planctomycetes bacterium]|jgi:hypothetical protein|nr:TfoX/Sxy family protein [Planctomycetota bacterium]MCL4729609.1 TfoX/Sxy family protein [Planctomycetota bacterium]
MPYDPRLFERVLDVLARKDGWTEKAMFGGRVCVRNGHPFIGTLDDGVIALCDEPTRQKHLTLKHCSAFVHGGRELPGWVKVSLEALKTAKQLSRWVEASYALAGALPPPRPARKAASKPATRRKPKARRK